jgi:dynein heavy chain
MTIYLFSFCDGKSSVRKIVATYKLCSEQLSSQDDCDYGVHILTAIILVRNTMIMV